VTAADVAGLARYRLQLRAADGDVFLLELLRPHAWPQASGVRPGDTVYVELDEMNVRGQALVTGWDASPDIDMDGQRGCLVTGTVSHKAARLSVLRLVGEPAPIVATPWHRVYSHTRDGWVAMADLAAGERLRTAEGTIAVASVAERRAERTPVFNLEVAGSHRYLVHERRVLTHNTYGTVGGGGAGVRAGPAALALRYKPFIRKYFRHNLGQRTGGIPENAHAHHVLPVQFARQCKRAGINIHEPKYGVWWTKGDHLSKAKAYNAKWKAVFRRTPPPTREDILQFGREIAKEYGFDPAF
jgi:hypothetical protein